MGNPYVIVGHDELINNYNHTSGSNNNNGTSGSMSESNGSNESLNERNYFSFSSSSSWLCGSGISSGRRGYGTMRYFCSYLFDPNFIPEVALIIDPFASKCIIHDPQTEKHHVIKMKPLRDSHLSQDIIHVINYLTIGQNCIIKWIICIGDLNKLQKHEIETSVEQMNEYRSIQFIEKYEGHMLFLMSQLGSTFSPNENVGIVVDNGNSADASLWKLHNGKMVKYRESTVTGSGINEGITVDDLKVMKEKLLDGRTCDNWVMEYSESKLVLEKFFDYKIHETFLMVGLGYRSLAMVEKSTYNYLSGGLYYSQMILNKCCHSTIIIGKDLIDESTINVEKKPTSNAQCTIL